jgi:hypothetical protein
MSHLSQYSRLNYGPMPWPRPLNYQQHKNLITEPAELEVALHMVAERGIQLQRVAMDLDRTTVAFWFWRRGVKPLPRYAALFMWFNYGIGKQEVAGFLFKNPATPVNDIVQAYIVKLAKAGVFKQMRIRQPKASQPH